GCCVRRSPPMSRCTAAGTCCASATGRRPRGSPPSRPGRGPSRRTRRRSASRTGRRDRPTEAARRERRRCRRPGAAAHPHGAGRGLARPRAGRGLAESDPGALPAAAAGAQGAAGALPRQRAGHAVELREAGGAVRRLLHRPRRVPAAPARHPRLRGLPVQRDRGGEPLRRGVRQRHRSITGNQALVSKIYLPSELFPWASMIVALVHFLPQLLVLVVGALLFGWLPSPTGAVAFGLGLVIL